MGKETQFSLCPTGVLSFCFVSSGSCSWSRFPLAVCCVLVHRYWSGRRWAEQAPAAHAQGEAGGAAALCGQQQPRRHPPHVHQAPGGNKPTGLSSASGKGQQNEQSKAKREAQFQVTLRFPLLVFVLFSCFGFWFLQEVGSARQAASRPRRAVVRFIQAAAASNCTRSKNMFLLHLPTDREQTTHLFCELISAHDFANHCLSCQPC